MTIPIFRRSPAAVLALISKLNISPKLINSPATSRAAQNSASPAGITIYDNQPAESEAAKVNTLQKNSGVLALEGVALRVRPPGTHWARVTTCRDFRPTDGGGMHERVGIKFSFRDFCGLPQYWPIAFGFGWNSI